ncbi:MAG: 16S rRNA (uracil(1498)-N(3))-methyltransferase [Treponema sp.]|jgi:16S rRNA U1498 N3-methylase RsmE|nr:16S rRNA (uracil(1498)-N(3))-methyltransferase [Treponema sp.]
MNLILFEEHEAGKPLPRRDGRCVHLLKVLRKKTGDSFDAGVLGGRRGTGTIEGIGPDGSLSYSLDLFEAPLPRFPLRLAVGFPRPIQLRRLLRDLSSLGLAALDLVGTDLGDKSYRDTNLLRDGGARSALIEGAVQSRDTSLPLLTRYSRLDDWLERRPWEDDGEGGGGQGGGGQAGNEQEGAKRPALLVAADNLRPAGSMAGLGPAGGRVSVAVGPERGWSDRERDLLEKAGFLRLSLGKRALRTETACVAAAILAMEKMGELG